VNSKLFTHPIVVYDLHNNGDAPCMRTGFEEYDYVCSVRLCGGERWGEDIVPLPTSTKRVKFDSGYNE
jgi:hypothetical protein